MAKDLSLGYLLVFGGLFSVVAQNSAYADEPIEVSPSFEVFEQHQRFWPSKLSEFNEYLEPRLKLLEKEAPRTAKYLNSFFLGDGPLTWYWSFEQESVKATLYPKDQTIVIRRKGFDKLDGEKRAMYLLDLSLRFALSNGQTLSILPLRNATTAMWSYEGLLVGSELRALATVITAVSPAQPIFKNHAVEEIRWKTLRLLTGQLDRILRFESRHGTSALQPTSNKIFEYTLRLAKFSDLFSLAEHLARTTAVAICKDYLDSFEYLEQYQAGHCLALEDGFSYFGYNTMSFTARAGTIVALDEFK